MSLAALVTANFPITDAALTAYSAIDYASVKNGAIERAKRDLYGAGVSVPEEIAIPDVAQYWIADKATLYLIPAAVDYYMNQHRLSDSKENANFSYYDKVQALRDLEAELKAAIERNREAAEEAIRERTESIPETPAVSVRGLLLDPTGRAYRRGWF
ncbi:MAG TPA: hypothetical protein PKH77_26095 [Anaerolineae bacterium]|nr:hypothetical protein [Anaerolineae bacterium]